MEMQLFVDEREVGAIAADVATTVAEVIEALTPHVEPGRILVGVEIDGQRFHAAGEGPWLRRRAATVLGLRLVTTTPAELALDLRRDVGAALDLIAGKLELAVRGLGRGEDRASSRLLAELIEELRLVLVLDQEVSVVDGRPAVADAALLEKLGEELLAAQRQADRAEMARLLENGLAPIVRSWRDAALGATGGVARAAGAA
jgi:hypothetical protein